MERNVRHWPTQFNPGFRESHLREKFDVAVPADQTDRFNSDPRGNLVPGIVAAGPWTSGVADCFALAGCERAGGGG